VVTLLGHMMNLAELTVIGAVTFLIVLLMTAVFSTVARRTPAHEHCSVKFAQASTASCFSPSSPRSCPGRRARRRDAQLRRRPDAR